MNARIALARTWLPAFIKKRGLLDLVRAAAASFSVDMPDFRGEKLDGILRRFAVMADEWARAAIREGRSEEVSKKLFVNARRIGSKARKILRPRTMTELMEAARVLYAAIGIDFRGDPQGQIVVRACSFSRGFTPEACRIMSSMDAGVLSGLAGDGKLEFSARLTEGAEACRARFSDGRSEP